MPNIKVSERYKKSLIENKKRRRQEVQKKYRLSRRDEYNRRQKLLMRSRLSKFKNGEATHEDVRKKRRLLQERVTRYRECQSKEESSRKRKQAKQRWQKCVENYENEIRQYHTHVCNCCGRLCRKSQLTPICKQNLRDKLYQKRFIEKVFWIGKNETEKFCKTCGININKGRVPKLCLANGLEFPKIDKSIEKLNRIEERLIAPRHVFQTLWPVRGPDGQYKTSGGIVNVPVSIDNTVNCLPRPIHDSNMIHVQLARRMSYIKNYMTGIVRPKLLYDAAKSFVTKPLCQEEGITLSQEWVFNDNDDNSTDLEDEFYTTNAIYETLLTNDSFNGLCQESIRMAPAEGFTPTSVLFDEHCEFLAFPKVFGGYKMIPTYNDKKIPYSDYVKSMALRYDRRVAERGDLLLFIAKKLELLKLYNNIGICLRKKSSDNSKVTAGNMLNSNYVEGIVQHNDGYKILKGIRSSPAHWQNEKTKLWAQIRQFGLPTIFLTLSSADIQWPELLVALKMSVDKEVISEEEAKELSYKERARLVQKDPITCSLHFDQRFKAIKKTWSSPEGPFAGYDVEHHYHRIEFQQRGSPHVHMLLWLKGAPRYDPDSLLSAKEVCSFIDKIISCSSQEISDELVSLQTHKHTHTCTKNRGFDKECRFGIPYFPMKQTEILKELDEDYDAKKTKKLKILLKKIKRKLNEESTLTLTFDEFLESLGISYKRYILAIRSSLKKPQIFLKRKPCDIFISPFSKKMIELMRSNQNIQFVLDAFGAACYIIDYINKSNRGMSNIMREILKNIREGNDSLKDCLKKISNAFHNNSELSIQEACYNILQLHLSESSEECVFIPTFPIEHRVKMVKSQFELEKLPEDSNDIFEHGLLDHYSSRPVSMENETLAEFAANYRYSRSGGPRAIPLQNKSGYIYRRTKSRVIRFRNYHYETDPNNYLREHLMLYCPWRDEKKDILKKDLEAQFKMNEEKIREKKSLFHSLEDKTLETAMHEAMEREEDESDENTDETRQTFDFDKYSLNDPFANGDIQREFDEEEKDLSVSFTAPGKVREEEFQEMMEKLNQDQRDYVMHVAHHFETSKKQLLHFLTGGAGVGKSLVIKTLYQTLYRLFNTSPDDNPDDPKILLCAPTGKASFNIGGQTIHSAFKLPLNQKKLNELSASISNTLSTKLHCLKVIIIDEISMVGQHILEMIG